MLKFMLTHDKLYELLEDNFNKVRRMQLAVMHNNDLIVNILNEYAQAADHQ